MKKTSTSIVRLGIFGGSFDPPHIAHLVIGETAREQLRLDRLIYVPTYQSPHKVHSTKTSSLHRLAMTRIAVRGNDSFEVSDLEVKKKGVSYTIETIQYFNALYPHSEIFFIVGSDSLHQFATWKEPEGIRSLVTLAVFPRRGYEHVAEEKGLIFLRAPLVDICSSDIRRRIKWGRSIRYLVPEKVEEYIRTNNIYKYDDV